MVLGKNEKYCSTLFLYYQRERTSVKNLGFYMSVFTVFRRVSEFYPVVQV